MQKNVASQKWIVFAFQDDGGTNPGEPVTGDAANITANLRIDGGAANAVDDVNPTELEDGYYVFDITAAESNGDLILIAPASATANVNVIGVPGAIWTTPANFPASNLTASGNIGIDWANVENPTTALNLSATNIDTDQVVASVSGAVGSVTGAVGSVAGNVGGNVTGSVGSISGIAFPTNFGDLAITVTTGQVTVGTNNDKTGYTASTVSDKTGYSISGTLTTLDALDTQQDTQHASTQSDIAALNNISAADVNAQVLDVLNTDTFAELGSVPAATSTLVQKLTFLFMLARNQVEQTETTATLRADNTTTAVGTATVSDDATTATKGEWG